MATSKNQKLILVVDDERDIVEIVTEILQGSGYRTLSAYDGHEAITLLEKHRPDAVVLDIKMPVIDGIGVIRYLRSKPALAATPIVVLTATQVVQEAREQFRQLGVHTWMTKPFEPDDLCAAVNQAVSRGS